MWIDKETWMALRYEMYDSKENMIVETEIHYLEINTGIPDSEFKFEVPEGAEINVLDLKENFKAPEKLSIEEARQRSSFEILLPEYVPEGYVLNYIMASDNYGAVPEGECSESVILSYYTENESFQITQTVYESKPEESILLEEMAENVIINGKEGKFISTLGDFKILKWEIGEFEMTLSGSLEKAEIVKIAESIPEPTSENS